MFSFRWAVYQGEGSSGLQLACIFDSNRYLLKLVSMCALKLASMCAFGRRVCMEGWQVTEKAHVRIDWSRFVDEEDEGAADDFDTTELRGDHVGVESGEGSPSCPSIARPTSFTVCGSAGASTVVLRKCSSCMDRCPVQLSARCDPAHQ